MQSLISKGKTLSGFAGIKGPALGALALALLASIAVIGAASGSAFRPVSTSAVISPLNAAVNSPFTSAVISPLDVAVSLPNLTASPGVVSVPITVGDLTSQGIFSFDLQVTYNPAVVTPASPAFLTPGTLSSAMFVTANTSNPGHLILTASQASPLDGSGALVFLRFNVIGTPGQVSALTFENYTDSGSVVHPGFQFNAGTPLPATANGSITVAGATSTSTATPTSTATSTSTATNTPTATSTPTGTPGPLPICVGVSMPNATTLTNTTISVPVNAANLSGTGAISASFSVNYSPGLITFTGVTFGPVGNSNGGGRSLSFSTPSLGAINVSISGGNEFVGSGALVNLNFSVSGLPGSHVPLNFASFQFNGGASCSPMTNGSVTVVAATITGKVTYDNTPGSPLARFVPNVLISAAGSPFVSALTDPSGAYTLSGFGAGSYTVTPTKSGGTNNAISGFDAARIAQYVVHLFALTPQQLAAADVSGAGGVSSFDASLMGRYLVALGPPVGSTGSWIFTPGSIEHSVIYTNVVGENYTALLMGDVSGNWNSPNSLPGGRPAISKGPERNAAVDAPSMATAADNDFVIPLKIQGAADKGVISYEFDLKYDPLVIEPQANVLDSAGTISRAFTAVANAEQPGLVKVVVFGAMPIDADGILLNLRFRAIGAPGSISPLTWERLVLNEGDPRVVTTDGSVGLISAASDNAEISGRVLSAYDAGISKARATLTDTTGRSRSTLTNGFGAYRFGALQMGETYTLSVTAKGCAFTPLTSSITRPSTSQDIIAEP